MKIVEGSRFLASTLWAKSGSKPENVIPGSKTLASSEIAKKPKPEEEKVIPGSKRFFLNYETGNPVIKFDGTQFKQVKLHDPEYIDLGMPDKIKRVKEKADEHFKRFLDEETDLSEEAKRALTVDDQIPLEISEEEMVDLQNRWKMYLHKHLSGFEITLLTLPNE